MSVLRLVSEDEIPASIKTRKPSALWTVAFVIVMLGSAAMAADGLVLFPR